MSISIVISKKILTWLGDPEYRQHNDYKKNKFRIKLLIRDKLVPDIFKPLRLMFIDETVNSYTKVSCFTSLYLRIKDYDKIRREIYLIHRKIKDRLGLGQYHDAVELHGKELLKGYAMVDDDFRYEILNNIVDIVNKYRIQVYRIGYNNVNEITKLMKGENEKLYGLHMLNYCELLNILTRKHKIFVIMDSIDQKTVNTLSRMVFIQTSNTLTFPDKPMSYVIDKPQNIIEAISYVDSRYSEMMQMTDLVSYLFNKLDYLDQGKENQLNNFAKELCKIGKRIDNRLVYNSIIKMNTPSA